jgi:hypothetical protein
LPDGRIRLYEKWKWLDAEATEGSSIIEEVGYDITKFIK